jgi:hypothetical protein
MLGIIPVFGEKSLGASTWIIRNHHSIILFLDNIQKSFSSSFENIPFILFFRGEQQTQVTISHVEIADIDSFYKLFESSLNRFFTRLFFFLSWLMCKREIEKRREKKNWQLYSINVGTSKKWQAKFFSHMSGGVLLLCTSKVQKTWNNSWRKQ